MIGAAKLDHLRRIVDTDIIARDRTEGPGCTAAANADIEDARPARLRGGDRKSDTLAFVEMAAAAAIIPQGPGTTPGLPIDGFHYMHGWTPF